MNANKSRWLGVWMAGLCLASTLPAHAVISAVNPAEGTVGTQFTIVGTDFGNKRGDALLGQEPLKIKDWSDTAITVEVWKAQPAGDYTISVSPKEKKKNATAPQTFSPFALRQPYIDPGEPMRLITPFEVITITGDFFGKKTGRVGMRDTTGLTLECRVYDWSENSITFQVPDGLTGTVILGVRNEVGVGIQRLWGTFTPLPPNMAKATRTYFIKETHENARGIYFNESLWLFYTQKDLATDKSNAIWASGFDYVNGDVHTGVPDPGGSSDAQVAPIVIDHELWLFVTGENNGIYYKKYSEVTNPDTQLKEWKWEADYHRIGSLQSAANKELAPVWNPITKQLDVYYWYANAIFRLTTADKGTHWSGPQFIANLPQVNSAPSATFWRKSDTEGVTLLAFSGPTTPDTTDTTRDYTKLYELKDGVVQGTGPIAWSPYATGQPFIDHLGEDYIGVVFQNVTLGQLDLAKLDVKTGTWVYNPTVPVIDQTTKRSPSFAVNMEEKVIDDSDPNNIKYRFDAVAYVFWGDDRGLIGTGAYMSSVEILGYWDETGQTDFDTAQDRVNSFPFWQVIGVIDAPPFVLNGSPYADECDVWTCNSVTFGTETSTDTSFGWDMTIGAYMETGDKSPVKVELSAVYGHKYEQTKTKTVEITSTLYRSKEGVVSVWYLAPKFRIHHIGWNDMTGREPTNFIPRIELLDTQLVSQEFDPNGFPWPDLKNMMGTYFDPVRFPDHAVADETAAGDLARLKTYYMQAPAPADLWFGNFVFWNRLADKHIKWTTAIETSVENSFNLEYKIGAQFGEYFGAGVQGSFGINTTTKVKVGNTSEVSLVPGSSAGAPFESFRVDAYWYAPNPNGYWVPLDRIGTGEAPWFITFKVSDINPPMS